MASDPAGQPPLLTAAPPATLRAVLAAHAARQPAHTFLITPENGRAYTYADLAQQARHLGASLAARGLAPGDTIATLLHNGWQTAAIFLGSMAEGYVCAPLNLIAQRSQLAYVIGHSDCKLVITSSDYEEQLMEALEDVSRAVAVVVIDVDQPALFAGATGALPAPALNADSPALLMYTSGTTGQPKGALLTHGNLLAAARTVAAWHGLTPADRVLSSLPLYHINGQVIATVTPFVSGGSIVAPHRFSTGNWWQMVRWHEPTWLNMVPTIIAYLLNAAEPGRTHVYPKVRFGRSASAPLPPEQHKAFERTFGISVIEAMGMTESASVVFCNPQEPARRKYGTPGLPCGVEARVVGLDGAVLGDGATGELMLRGPNVMRAYYKSPEQTRAALDADGWLHTGDLGYRDPDGFYFVTGRIKELIIKGGENIAPREIDEALLKHPAVLEAAAVGIPDVNYGQDILACVVLKPGAACDERTLRAHCLIELGRFKTPREFRFVAELPKGASGKVQRLKLLE
ncbi:MAG: AMP-binding protein [Betaproteobacteria bacterium]|nr:AMP-binding protein [Betaproteobacteria bacterium]